MRRKREKSLYRDSREGVVGRKIEKVEKGRRNPWKEKCEQLDFEIANFIFAPGVSKGSNQAARCSFPSTSFLFFI